MPNLLTHCSARAAPTHGLRAEMEHARETFVGLPCRLAFTQEGRPHRKSAMRDNPNWKGDGGGFETRLPLPASGRDRPRFAAGEMRPNGARAGQNGSRVWEKRRKSPLSRRPITEGICRWRYFLSVKKVTKAHSGFAVETDAALSATK